MGRDHQRDADRRAPQQRRVAPRSSLPIDRSTAPPPRSISGCASPTETTVHSAAFGSPRARPAARRRWPETRSAVSPVARRRRSSASAARRAPPRRRGAPGAGAARRRTRARTDPRCVEVVAQERRVEDRDRLGRGVVRRPRQQPLGRPREEPRLEVLDDVRGETRRPAVCRRLPGADAADQLGRRPVGRHEDVVLADRQRRVRSVEGDQLERPGRVLAVTTRLYAGTAASAPEVFRRPRRSAGRRRRRRWPRTDRSRSGCPERPRRIERRDDEVEPVAGSRRGTKVTCRSWATRSSMGLSGLAVAGPAVVAADPHGRSPEDHGPGHSAAAIA